MCCKARIVSFSELYGGKIAAALSRQHPRDIFYYKYYPLDSFDEVKSGLILYLLGSDKPILESLQPNSIDQKDALENQFRGMTDVPFSYDDYEISRQELIDKIKNGLTEEDKTFLLSFEKGKPDWDKCCAGDLSSYPSVKWKLQNIIKLKETNPNKFNAGVEKLREFLFPSKE